MSNPSTDDPSGHAARGLLNLLRGVETFTHDVYPESESLFKDLANRQAPHTLFLTCCDSRIVPELITQTQPGELFVSRNIGNIVPAYGEVLGGVSAVIEYAVMVLGVQQIVICGHSDCGAMKGLLGPPPNDMPTVAAWLRHAEAARSVVFARELAAEHNLRAMIEENVHLQLAHLRTHPAVAARLAQKRLMLQGWVYDIEHGQVAVFTDDTSRLLTLAEAIEHLEREIPA